MLPTEYRRKVAVLAAEIGQPDFKNLLRRFLYDQLHPDSGMDVPLSACPEFDGKISVFNSATATFHAPSDLSDWRYAM
jgi:hypothetical protein